MVLSIIKHTYAWVLNLSYAIGATVLVLLIVNPPYSIWIPAIVSCLLGVILLLRGQSYCRYIRTMFMPNIMGSVVISPLFAWLMMTGHDFLITDALLGVVAGVLVTALYCFCLCGGEQK